MTAVFAGLSGALLACAGILGFEDFSLEQRDAEEPDSGPDAGPDTGPCGYDKDFGTPAPVDLRYDGGTIWGAWLSRDEDEIYFGGTRSDNGTASLYTATRDGGRGPFATPSRVGCCDAGPNEHSPTLTEDGTLMVFAASPEAGANYDLFVARRDASNRFGEARRLALNSDSQQDWAPFLASAPGARKLWFTKTQDLKYFDIFVANFAADGGTSSFNNVNGINQTGTQEDNPVLSADGHNLYFSSSRDGANTAVWVAHRDNLSDDLDSWSTPRPAGVSEVLTGDQEHPVWISRDECRLYYMIYRPKDSFRQLYVVERGR